MNGDWDEDPMRPSTGIFNSCLAALLIDAVIVVATYFTVRWLIS